MNGLLRIRLVLYCSILWSWLATPCRADIYVHDAEDGTTLLSNVHTGNHYAVLIREGAPPAPGKAGREHYRDVVHDVARAYGVESALLHAVISVESQYSVRAVSRKGAAGLMQLMPDTARRYGVLDSFDPVQNLHGGTRYLRDLLAMFNGDKNLALAAYNAGEHAVLRAGYRIPPFRETKDYVRRVQALYMQFKSGPERLE